MKVGDLVKYEYWHEDLQDVTGLVIEVASDRVEFSDRVRVLWSKARPGPTRWDWMRDLRIIK